MTSKGSCPFVGAMRAAWVVTAAACLALTAPTTDALTINLTFDSSVSDSPGFDPDALQLTPVLRQAANFWEDIIEDSWTLNVRYYYDDLGDASGTLADHLNGGVVGGKPTNARLRFDTQSGGIARDWWFDPTPADSSEFNLTQTLYRDLTVQQQTGWFGGSSPDVMEVGYRGSAVEGGVAVGHYDIFSTVIHELGHAVGLTSAVSAGEYADGDYDVPGELVYGTTTTIEGDFHLDDRLALMLSGGATVSSRRMPTATDVFAAASGSGWTGIDLSRQDFWGGGDWNTAFNWEGNQVPDALDEACVRLRGSDPTVSLSANASAASLFVGEGDNVNTSSYRLDIGGAAIVDGPGSALTVSAAGELRAATVRIQNQAEVYVTGGLVDADSVTIDPGAWLTSATGTPIVDVQTRLTNNGTIRALNNATLTFTSSGGGVWDLDGTSGGVVEAVSGDVNFASGSLTDAFDGTMRIGAGRTLTIAQPWTLGGGGLIDLNGGTVAGGAVTNGGTTTGYGKIAAAGFANDVDGLLWVSGGTLTIDTPSTTFLDGGCRLDGNLRLEGSAVIHSGAVFSGSGDLVVAVAATLDIGDGVVLGVDLVNNGRIDIGASPGEANVTGDFTQTADATLAIELAGTAPGEFDVLHVSGTSDPDGSLEVTKLDLYVPAWDDEWIIMTAGGFFGSFASVTDGFQVNVVGLNLVLSLDLVPGDANADGVVDLQDFGLLKANFGGGGDWGHGDFNDDGVIDLQDFGLLKANFAFTSTSALGSAGAASVPEPASLALFVAGAFIGVLRRTSPPSRG